MPSHWCPEYVTAVESEQLDRVKALVGQGESIAGYPVNSLTPYLLDVLTAKRSAYAIGGIITNLETLSLIYFLTPKRDFSTADNVANWFEEQLLKPDYELAKVHAAQYMSRAFMDAPDGPPQVPYFPLSVSLMHQMASDPYRWDTDRTYQTPLREIFQFQRAAGKAKGAILINNRSDIVTANALDKLTAGIADGTITRADIDRINGVAPGTNPDFESPNYILSRNAAESLKKQMEDMTRG